MSKLGYNIKLMDMHEHAPRDLLPSLTVNTRWDNAAMERGRVYELGIRLATRIVLPDIDLLQGRRDEKLLAAEVMDNARKILLSEVFGEFETPLRHALAAAYNQETHKCVRLLQAVIECLRNAKPYEESNG